MSPAVILSDVTCRASFGGVRKQPPLTERDVDDVMRALFVIRANTDEILKLLREDDGEEEEGNEDA